MQRSPVQLRDLLFKTCLSCDCPITNAGVVFLRQPSSCLISPSSYQESLRPDAAAHVVATKLSCLASRATGTIAV